MNTVVCTLFEGHYHNGVSALVNSLYNQGFRGDIYAGYKGSLPDWAKDAVENNVLNKENAKTLNIKDGLQIHFILIVADYHLTNYKPNFMIDIWNGAGTDIDGMFYFDPDIVVKIDWSYFEKWIEYGVALIHEVTSNDMPPTHPKRKGWEEVIAKAGMEVKNQLHAYINAGFCGLHKENKMFLNIWRDIFQIGVKYFHLSNNQWGHNLRPDYIFFAQDQDALNIAAMCSTVPISEMGPEAMDFISGGWVMSHLVGSPKPWKKNMFKEFFYGRRLGITDKLFWSNVSYPIRPYNKVYIIQKNVSIKVVSFLSRFYKK